MDEIDWEILKVLDVNSSKWMLREIERAVLVGRWEVKEEIQIDVDRKEIRKIINNVFSLNGKKTQRTTSCDTDKIPSIKEGIETIPLPLAWYEKANLMPLMKIKEDHRNYTVVPRNTLNKFIIKDFSCIFKSNFIEKATKSFLKQNNLQDVVDDTLSVIVSMEPKNEFHLLKEFSLFPPYLLEQNEFNTRMEKKYSKKMQQYINSLLKELIDEKILNTEKENIVNELKKHSQQIEAISARILKKIEELESTKAESLDIKYFFLSVNPVWNINSYLKNWLLKRNLPKVKDAITLKDFLDYLNNASQFWVTLLNELLELGSQKKEKLPTFVKTIIAYAKYTILAIYFPFKKGEKNITTIKMTYSKAYKRQKNIIGVLYLSAIKKAKERRGIGKVWHFIRSFISVILFEVPFTKNVIVLRPNYTGARSFHYEYKTTSDHVSLKDCLVVSCVEEKNCFEVSPFFDDIQLLPKALHLYKRMYNEQGDGVTPPYFLASETTTHIMVILKSSHLLVSYLLLVLALLYFTTYLEPLYSIFKTIATKNINFSSSSALFPQPNRESVYLFIIPWVLSIVYPIFNAFIIEQGLEYLRSSLIITLLFSFILQVLSRLLINIITVHALWIVKFSLLIINSLAIAWFFISSRCNFKYKYRQIYENVTL